MEFEDDDKPLGVFIGMRNALGIIMLFVCGGLALRWWLA